MTNLPTIAARLIGRDAATKQVMELLGNHRAVTLTGPGGVGKTALALLVATNMLAEFGNDVRLVELASLSNPALVTSAAAGVLDLKLGGERISAETIARAIGNRRLLIVLDNCEHVINAAAGFAEVLLHQCPNLSILATSQEMLRMDGEYVYRVPSLELPPPDTADPGAVLAHSAVEMFVARTRAQDSEFSPAADDLQVIAGICRHLDGIPLAIEFAAARSAVLGVRQVASGLNDRFALLTSGRRTAVPRHRTLRAALDWSYELLPEPERLLLRRLAIFPAGFTIDAATAVMRESGLDTATVADCISNLVTRSLVALDTSGASMRWSMLETTRTYAREKLAAHGEAESVARSQAAYFRDRFVSPVAGFRSRLSHQDLTRYAREIDNVRAALDWAFSSSGDKTIGVELTAAYAPVWVHLSLLAECHQRCERALSSAGHDPSVSAWAQMWLRIALGNAMITTMGPSERAQTLLVEALATAETLNDLDAQARAVTVLVGMYVYRGQYAEARLATERLSRIAERIGDPALGIIADRAMGTRLVTAGRPREAQECLERVLRSPVVPDDRSRSSWRHSEHRATARAMLARALWMLGFVDKARAEAFASLAELRDTDHQLSLCRVLYYGICRITPMTGDVEAAGPAIARLVEVATSANLPFWQTAGRFLTGKLLSQRGEFARGLEALRDAFNTCDRTGWRMSWPEFRGALASSLAGLERLDEALETVDQAIAGAGKPGDGDRWYVPELLRIKGDILLGRGSFTAAEQCLAEAGAMAREQQSLFWELRIALSVARRRVAQGRPDDARQILAPVFDRFTEGFATADLTSARTLLAAL